MPQRLPRALPSKAAGSFAFIGTVADLDARARRSAARRACRRLCCCLPRAPKTPDLASLHHQRLRLEVCVVIVCQNLRDATGAAASEPCSRRLQVRAALMGWVPDAANGGPSPHRRPAARVSRPARLVDRDEFRVMTDYAA